MLVVLLKDVTNWDSQDERWTNYPEKTCLHDIAGVFAREQWQQYQWQHGQARKWNTWKIWHRCHGKGCVNEISTLSYMKMLLVTWLFHVCHSFTKVLHNLTVCVTQFVDHFFFIHVGFFLACQKFSCRHLQSVSKYKLIGTSIVYCIEGSTKLFCCSTRNSSAYFHVFQAKDMLILGLKCS